MGSKVGAWRVNERWNLREQELRCARQQREEDISHYPFLLTLIPAPNKRLMS